MALIAGYRCVRCGEEKYELVLSSRVCAACRELDHQAALKARRVFLAGLKGMTTDERLERIEAILYDLDGAARLTALEGELHPPTY